MKVYLAVKEAVGWGVNIDYPDNSAPVIYIEPDSIIYKLKELGYEVREIPETDGELVRRSL